jgi:hypothetical protein
MITTLYLIIVKQMSPFICKSPCTCTCILDIADCPPYDVEHEIPSYPRFYDLLYYPIYHSVIYENPASFCHWLQTTLTDHMDYCFLCLSPGHAISVQFATPDIVVHAGHHAVSLSLDDIESSTYSHCAVFQHLALCSWDSVLDMNMYLRPALNTDPAWFSHSEGCHEANLCALPAPVLQTAAQLIGYKHSDAHIKGTCIQFLLHVESRS